MDTKEPSVPAFAGKLECEIKKKNLKQPEYSQIYGGGKTKFYDLIRRGLLQKVKIDGMTFVTTESAEALQEQSLVKKGSA